MRRLALILLLVAPAVASASPPGTIPDSVAALFGVTPRAAASVLDADRKPSIAIPTAPGEWTSGMPPTFYPSVAAWDAARDRLLLLHGSDFIPGNHPGWALDLGQEQWSFVIAGAGDPPLEMSGVLGTMDTLRGRLLLYGGAAGYQLLPIAYAVDLDEQPRWHVLRPRDHANVPPTRSDECGAYDLKRDRLVIFGGRVGRDLANDAWALSVGDSNDWMRYRPAGTQPAGRIRATAVYDPVRDQLIVFGGYVLVSPNSLDSSPEVWTLSLADSGTWTQLEPTGELPGPMAGHQAVWDDVSSTMLVFNGGDVFQFDPAKAHWTHLSVDGRRRSRYRGPLAYDRARDRWLTFGGGTLAEDETDVDAFSLRPSPSWNRLPGRALPIGRFGQATIHDTKHDRVIVFGGVTEDFPYGNSRYLADPEWASLAAPFDWQPLNAQGEPPPPRHEPVGVYDPKRDRAVFFGGWTYESNYFDDVWTLDLGATPTWHLEHPAGPGPAGRRAHAAILDPMRDRMIVYGGSDDSTRFGDVWSLDLAEPMRWTRLETQGEAPEPRYFPAAVYDAARDALFIHGGHGGNHHSVGDAWELGLADLTWKRVEIPGYSLELERHVLSYDAARDRVLLHGGWSVDYDVLSSLWGTFALEFRPVPRWTFVPVLDRQPEPRIAETMVFDALRDRLFVFAGNEGFGPNLNDRWLLPFTPDVTRHAFPLAARATPGGATITWQAGDAPWTDVAVERAEEGGVFRTVGVPTLVSDGRLAFVDTGLRVGWRYSYQLRFTLPGGGLEWSGRIAVDIPGASNVDFVGARPNPARASALALWFSLPVQGDVRVTLYDLRGRVAWSEVASGLGQGPQVVRPDVKLPAGLYFAEVAQAGRRAVRKVTIVP